MLGSICHCTGVWHDVLTPESEHWEWRLQAMYGHWQALTDLPVTRRYYRYFRTSAMKLQSASDGVT